MSSFLVVAALIAAGGVGRFLWKYQASLDQETLAPVAAVPEPHAIALVVFGLAVQGLHRPRRRLNRA